MAARAARVRAKLTQEDVAERVGLATEVYGRLERGGMLPSVTTLRKLSQSLSIPSDVLLGLCEDEVGKRWAEPEPPPKPPEESVEIRRLVRTVKQLNTREFRLLYLLASGLLRLANGRPGRSRRERDTSDQR